MSYTHDQRHYLANTGKEQAIRRVLKVADRGGGPTVPDTAPLQKLLMCTIIDVKLHILLHSGLPWCLLWALPHLYHISSCQQPASCNNFQCDQCATDPSTIFKATCLSKNVKTIFHFHIVRQYWKLQVCPCLVRLFLCNWLPIILKFGLEYSLSTGYCISLVSCVCIILKISPFRVCSSPVFAIVMASCLVWIESVKCLL